MIFRVLIICPAILVMNACDTGVGYKEILAPKEVREQAIYYARKYIELGAVYEWGGQDPLPRRIAVDCSGLVIRCYEYAAADYGCHLLFNDTNSSGLRNYCLELDLKNVELGDLIFMGTDGVIKHVALFVARESGNIIFIDSTLKEEEGINGVSERQYPETDERFISFGRMRLRK